NSARLAAVYLKSIGADAYYIDPGDAGLYLTDEFGNAQVLPESYANLSSLKDNRGIILFPGFFGYTKSGDVVTFSRGGSDITGSILAASVGAEVYENFTDVDFVFAANPGIVDSPEPIKEITYSEMRELSYAGFSVLHEDTLEPVYRAGIPVNIRNTNNPSSSGTMITKKGKADKERHVTGVAGASGFCSIFVSKYLMNREIGFGRKLLSILEDEGIPYEHMPSGIDNISVILKEKFLTASIENKIIGRIKNELYVDDVYIEHGQSLIIIVGIGMKNSLGLAARAAKALAAAKVNLEMINQGSSEISMMFGVIAENCEKAVKALYDEFFRKS
ncbi:MAG: aspartate kinase, partial [Eubacteriales bacterium]|nr:aspartate kinase [Eubacteriales bacterium]